MHHFSDYAVLTKFVVSHAAMIRIGDM